MGRSPRLTYRGALHHVTMRCNNKEFLFDEQSFRLFLDLLAKTASKYKVPVHNYCLMTNHVHLLFTVPLDDTLSQFMHRLANVFAKRFNLIRERKGHLWEGRFRSTIVEPSAYFLRCMAYIDLNPVRARIVGEPGDYRWCGHGDLLAERKTFIVLHKSYLELGRDKGSRRRAYLKLLDEEAKRKAYSLAETLFVGNESFTLKLQRRFGISSRERPRVRCIDLGGGIEAIELQAGGSRSKIARPL